MGDSRLPQNINNLLMEIGEKSALFYLYLHTRNTEWKVYYNLNEVGCDIVLINALKARQINIEVKTRQRLYTTGKNVGFNFQLTENEYTSAHFLIAYWFEKNMFLIVPKNELKHTTSNGNGIHYIRVTPKKDGSIGGALNKYIDNWNPILDMLKE